MTQKALTYAWIIIATGIVVVSCAACEWRQWGSAPFLACLGLAGLASTFKVKLPNLTSTISPGFVFLLVAVGTLGWSETVIIAAVSGVVQCLWRAQRLPSPLQVAFNAATMAISGGVAHGLAHGTTDAGRPEVLSMVLGAAGVALLVSNTLLVSAMLTLIKEASFRGIWRSCQMWAVPYYLWGGLLAAVWARTDFNAGVGNLVLATASVYVLSICYAELGLRVRQRRSPLSLY